VIVGVIDGELDGVEVVPVPGRMATSTVLDPSLPNLASARPWRLSVDGGNPVPRLDLTWDELEEALA
jgi:hypothetical protein